MLHVAQFMCKHLGPPGMVPQLPGHYRPFDQRHVQLDGTELRNCGWTGPEVSLEEGLRMHCDWLREEHERREGGFKDVYSALVEKQLAAGDVKRVASES